MSVRKRNDTNSYMIDFYFNNNQGKRKRFRRSTGPGATLKEAKKMERELKAQLETQDTTRVAPCAAVQVYEKAAAFSGFAKYWLDNYASANNKASEVRSKRKILRVHLVPFFSNQGLREIDSEQITTFIAAQRKKSLAAKTINNHLTVLRTMLNTAIDWGYLEHNPMARIKALKEKKPSFDFFTPDEVERFLEKAEQVRRDWYPFFLTAFRTGMRLGELLELRWKDIDFERLMLCVERSVYKNVVGTPKSGKSRFIPMTDTVAETLRKKKGARNALVFAHANGGYLTRDMVKRPFWALCKTAKLREIRLHDMRHSFASSLVIKGVQLQTVQELLGHSDIRMTMRYSHLTPDQHHDAVALLEEKTEPKSRHVLGTEANFGLETDRKYLN